MAWPPSAPFWCWDGVVVVASQQNVYKDSPQSILYVMKSYSFFPLWAFGLISSPSTLHTSAWSWHPAQITKLQFKFPLFGGKESALIWCSSRKTVIWSWLSSCNTSSEFQLMSWHSPILKVISSFLSCFHLFYSDWRHNIHFSRVFRLSLIIPFVTKHISLLYTILFIMTIFL